MRILKHGGDVAIGWGSKIGNRCVFAVRDGGSVVIGKNVGLYQDVEIRAESGVVSIGRCSTLQRGVLINGDVARGEDRILAPNVFLPSWPHDFYYLPELPIREQDIRYKYENGIFYKLVIVEADVLFRTNVVILFGVRINMGSVVGANSVVNTPLYTRLVCAGVPAKVLKER